MDKDYPQLMKEFNVVGLSAVFIEDGKISQQKNLGKLQQNAAAEVSNNTIFNTCSISKLFTAILTLILVSEGKLHLDENIQYYLTSWRVPKNQYTKKKPITLRHLLSHQGGFIDPDNSFPPLDSKAGFPPMKDLLEGKTVYLQQPCAPEYDLEKEYNYSDTGYCIIQQLIEEVCGRNFADVLEEKLLRPLGLEHTFVNPLPADPLNSDIATGHDKAGNPIPHEQTIYPFPAAAGVWTSPSDLAQVLVMLLQAFRGEGDFSLPKNLVQEMFSEQCDKDWIGLGVFLDHENDELEISSLGWGVGFQSLLAAEPKQGRGLIVLTNSDLGVHQLNGIIGEIYHTWRI